MGALPHVVTVDLTGAVGRIVRAAIDLTGRSVVQIDVPGGVDALDEIRETGCRLLVTALHLTAELQGIDLALGVHEIDPDAALIVVGDVDDPEELDAEYRATAPFVYLHRPVDGAHFLTLLADALAGKDILSVSAATSPPARRAAEVDMGAIPSLDMKIAERVIDTLLIDVGAMAIVVANRGGDVLLERGAVGYLDREQLTGALLPMVRTTVEMGQLVGGRQPSALQFFDGDRYDVFVLSVGFHHFMCLVFDGQIGGRQFGAVNRFGRRAAEDLIAMLGINAFTLTPSVPETEQTRRLVPESLVAAAAQPPVEAPLPQLERAEAWAVHDEEPEPLPEPEPVRLEPIENLDVSLFDVQAFENLDISMADSLFDMDTLAEIANETRRERGPLSYDEARELGIIP
jgi:DNA-binding NarL/FixJ family response regulator